jgi:hypothetical protein
MTKLQLTDQGRAERGGSGGKRGSLDAGNSSGSDAHAAAGRINRPLSPIRVLAAVHKHRPRPCLWRREQRELLRMHSEPGSEPRGSAPSLSPSFRTGPANEKATAAHLLLI